MPQASDPEFESPSAIGFGFDSVMALYERVCERRRRLERFRIPSFTCPVCTRTSWNPDDVREGYCGSCRSWTGIPHE